MILKPEIKYGILAAIGMIAWIIIQYLLGFHTKYFQLGEYAGVGKYLFISIALWLSLKEKYTDLVPNFTLRTGIRSGLIQLIIIASVSSAFMFLYNYKINPLWVEKLVAWQIENGNAMSFAILANDSAASSNILSNTETHLCIYFLSTFVVGGSIAFLFSAILYNRSSTQIQSKKQQIDPSDVGKG